MQKSVITKRLQRAPKLTWKRRTVNAGLMALYCATIFLVLDLIYSKIIYEKDRSGRIANEYYHHGFASNFAGYHTWASQRAKLYTNSLGFKDARIRNVPARTDARRIIMIGDSMTEGIGLAFEQTFTGLLYSLGQKRNPKTEFLNAGVISYSPAIYHAKIKYFLNAGLHFDEVVVLPDLSDVQDEATSYFCIDKHPEFRRYCPSAPAPPSAPPSLDPLPPVQPSRTESTTLKDYFVITSKLLEFKWNSIRPLTLGHRQYIASDFDAKRSAWMKPGFDPGNSYDPLGIDGGINRSLTNMQTLAELLRSNGIGLTIAVYPWPSQLLENDRRSRHVEMWRGFCAKHCKKFIDLFPVIFAEKDARDDWYEYLFIPGDVHYSAAGNRVISNALAKHLL